MVLCHIGLKCVILIKLLKILYLPRMNIVGQASTNKRYKLLKNVGCKYKLASKLGITYFSQEMVETKTELNGK